MSKGSASAPSKPTPQGAAPGVARVEARHTAVLCDVENVATVLREAGLDLEDAPAALTAVAGEAGVRRVYALGNRFSRLRRVLEDAGYERVSVEGTPASLRLQMAVDAVDLSHRDPGSSFLLAASGDEIQPLIERLEGEGRVVALFAAEALADVSVEAGGRDRRERDEEAPAPTPPRAARASALAASDADGETDETTDDETDEDGAFDDEEVSYDDEAFDDEAFDDEDEELEDEAFEDEDFDEDAFDRDDNEDEESDPYDDDGRADEPRRETRAAVEETGTARARPTHPAPSGPRPAARPQRSDRRPPERRPPPAVARAAGPAARERDAGDPFGLLLGAIERIVQGPPRLVFESVVRQEILEMEPGFNEREAGFGSFTEFFEEAQERGLIQLAREPATGTYVVVGARLAG